MSEFVVTVHPRGRRIDRVAAALDRLGERHDDTRTMDVAFDLLVAAKDRFPINRVHKHVCRHDEGVNDCAATATVG